MNNIKILFILFLTYSIIGWIIEMIATVIEDHEIVNRGFLIGPYCPIYGVCSILMLLLLNKVNNVVLLFILSILICSIGEYITSYLLEKIFKARWWDYSKTKFNLNGRICLQNCLLFGVLGFLVVKYINNFFLNIYTSINPSLLDAIFYITSTIFIIDLITSFNVIFKIKKTIKHVNLDNTKEISLKVKKVLTDNILVKRIFKAFPNIKLIDRIKNRIRK